MNKIAYSADHSDVFRHLATEELILDSLPPKTTVLYLWTATDAMVIGKNQNPWLECNMPLMARKTCCLARRISGGGAVFHDSGNLNYSFFMSKSDYDRDAISSMIVEALDAFGVSANVGERHLLEVNGKKFSGNAFCIRREKVLHHGTLLINADLQKLVDYATPTCDGIDAKGIRSIPSTVGNLSDYSAAISCDALKDRIYHLFEPDVDPLAFESDRLDERTDYFQGNAWLYHRTPRFIARGQCSETGGRFEAEVVKGRIKTVTVDPENVAFMEQVAGMDFRDFLTQNPQLILE